MNFLKFLWIAFVALLLGAASSVYGQVANPVIAVVSANPSQSTVSVSISESTPNSPLYYTTNGTVPSSSSTTIASGGVLTLNASQTLKVVAISTSGPASAIVTATFAPGSSLSSSGYHTVIVKNDGSILSVGQNTSGQLGINSNSNASLPTQITQDATGAAFNGVNAVGTLTSSAASPVQIPNSGLALWLRADLGVTNDSYGVKTWQDQSGNANNATALYQTTSGRATVVTNSLNGQPVIRLAGQYASTFSIPYSSTLQPSTGVTIISVLRPATPNYNNTTVVSDGYTPSYGLGINGSSQNFTGSELTTGNSQPKTVSTTSVYSPNQPYLVANVYNGTTQSLYQDGTLSSQSLTGTLTYSGNNTFYIGYAGYYYTGDIAEVIIYNRALTAAELQTVQGYLSDKWGVYSPYATWTKSSNYSPSVQSLIASNQWTKAQASAYVQSMVVNPSVPSDVVLWLKADAGINTSSGNITSWADQSIYQNNAATQFPSSSTGRATIVSNSLNGRPVVHFPGGSSQTLTITGNGTLQPSSAVTVISVLRPSPGSNQGSVISDGYSNYSLGIGANQTFTGTEATGTSGQSQTVTSTSIYTPKQPYLATSLYNGNAQSFYVAGQLAGTQAQTGPLYYGSSPQPFYLGYSSYYSGDIAEVLVYNRALSPAELQNVHGYLADKWGVYAPSATWPLSFASNVQTLIAANQWTEAQANAYVAAAKNNPILPPDMSLWLKADLGASADGNGNLLLWQDQSLYHNDATPYAITGSGRATVVGSSLNGNAVVHLAGGQASSITVMDSQSLRATSGLTVLTVVRPGTQGGNPSYLLSEGTNPTYAVETSNQTYLATELTGTVNQNQVSTEPNIYSLGQPYLVTNLYDGINQSILQNGQMTQSIPLTGSLSYPTGAQSLSLGYFQGNAYIGDIAEVIVYNRALSASELQSAQQYLADKWGFYAPNATWPQQFAANVQTFISANQWTKAQATAYVALAAANPSIPADMAVWLRADNPNLVFDQYQNLTVWPDSGIYQNDAQTSAPGTYSGRATFQAAAGSTPALINFPGGSYDGFAIPDAMDLQPPSGLTVVAVVYPGTSTDSQPDWLVNKGTENSYALGVTPSTSLADATVLTPAEGALGLVTSNSSYVPLQPAILATVYNGTSENLFQSGALVGSNPHVAVPLTYNTGNSGPETLTIAGSSSGYFTGSVAEILVYNRALSSAEFQSVEFYLAAKYAITLGSSSPTIAGTAGGSYTGSTTVTFNAAPSGYEIRYTLDGTQPTSSSTLYSGPITLTGSAPITYQYFLMASHVAMGPSATTQYYVNDSGKIGITDAWQTRYYGHTGIVASALAVGGSGLTNLQAYLYGYDPTKFSTNGDGLSDLINHQLGYSATNLDINNYGLTNAQQLALGLDPFDTGINPALPTPPTPNPNDHVALTVTIDLPANATPH